MIGNEEGVAIVSLFYAAAAGEVPWRDALQPMADLFRSSATLLAVHRPCSMQVLAIDSHSYSHDFMNGFFAGDIYANDPRVPHIERIAEGAIYYDEMLYDVAEMERNPWVQASTAALGVVDQLGAKLRLPENGMATVGLLRTRSEGRATPAAIQAFSLIAPGIERACALGYLVERESATRQTIFQAMSGRVEGLILLDASGRAIFLNAAAEQCLAMNDGLSLRGGQFSAWRAAETRRLRQLLGQILGSAAGAATTGGGRMLVTRPSGRKPFVLTLTQPPPAHAFLTGRGIACVLHLQDLDTHPLPRAADLRAVFGLTHREADLAVELVRTARLDQASARCGIALNTGRNHLQAIFGKTGTKSQAELVQLLGRIA